MDFEDFVLESTDDLDSIVVPDRVPRILRVPWANDLEGLVCCTKLWKLPIHYHAKRSRICPGKAKCDIHSETSLRIYWLCALYLKSERELCWYQLPPGAAKSLLLAAKTMKRSPLGLAVRIRRKWADKNAPVLLSVDQYSPPPPDGLKPVTPEKSVKLCFFSEFGKTSTNRKKAV